MNTKDFVVIPWGKPGNSVKLKYKNARELQMEKIQLELETQTMENKFREFQSTWNKGKEEMKSSGYYWNSGSVGKLGNKSHLTSQSKVNASKLTSGNVKLKILKEQIQAPAKQQVNYKMAQSFEREMPKTKRKVCGQCENKAALLVCLECGEDYCSGCFAKIHQKGALKFHRTTLLQAKSQILSNVLDVAYQFIKEANPPNEGNTSPEASSKSQEKPKAPLLQDNSTEVEITAAEGGESTNSRYNPLCEVPFDEEASAQSFREALTQWRAGHQEENKQQKEHAAKPVCIFIDSVEECEVQTNLKIWTEPINIEFTEDSLTYMEKLWLKKHRRTPQEQLRNLLLHTSPHSSEATMEAQSSQNENDVDSDVEEIKVQYPPLFMPVEKLNIERPPPSLTIVELYGTHETDFEEPENAVPYRVELADAESQLSSPFPDYRNCFPREHGIHQHLVFNRGKTDLLSLCLRTNSTNRNDDLKGQKSQRPSTANFPVSGSAQKGSSSHLFSYPRSRSVAAQPLSRAASEISEIEYIDVTDQNEPFLDNAEDQQALESLEKELNTLKNLADPSEKPQSLPSEELPAFTRYSLNFNQMSEDLLEMPCDDDNCEIEMITSGRNTEIQPLLSLGDYSTDEDEEDFLDKQHVSTLPWVKDA